MTNCSEGKRFLRFLRIAADRLEGSSRLEPEKLSTIGQRFERSPVGEMVVSVVVVVVLAIGVVWSMPDAAVKRLLTPGLQPVATATGLEQDWRMYAPEPLQQVEYVEVRVTMIDGTQRVWTIPRGDRVVGAFTWYRWQKLKENLVGVPGIRAGLAHWVVRQLTRPSERAARLQMTLRAESLTAPGTNGPCGTDDEILYDETLTGTR